MKITNSDGGIEAAWEFESTGRQLQISVGYVVGLDIVDGPEDRRGTVHTGYDNDLVEDLGFGGPLTHDEQRELALFMIDKWRRFGAGESDGKETSGEAQEGETAKDYAKWGVGEWRGERRRRRST